MSFTIWKKDHWLIPAEKDVLKDQSQYYGRTVTITDDKDYRGRKIQIEKVVGSLTYPSMFEVTPSDGTAIRDKDGNKVNAFIIMLDFFNQMGDGSIPRDEIELWNESTFEVEQHGGNRIWRPGKSKLN